jgi:MinD-like ATPase involved in chromosome partitioning or flagellar assembly
MRSLNRGIPLVIRYPRSPVSRAIHQLTKRLPQTGMLELVAPKPDAAKSKSQQDVLMASSQLG